MPGRHPTPLPPYRSFTDRIDDTFDAVEKYKPLISTILAIAVLLMVWSCWPRT